MKTKVLEIINDIRASKSMAPVETLNESDNLRNDLGLTSFDLAELTVRIEDEFDIDIFEVGGQYYISEVNPRFGGGYPHAYESGCDHMKLILENLRGNANTKNIGAYEEGIYMMKYNEVMLKKI